ncbi:MAG: thiolase family protein [Firmicutes bacterium]|nr:thiolase family protein [Bacillota bacterium]
MSMRRVAIVSVAQTEHKERHEETVRELVYRVAKQALSQVGLTRDELGTVITSSSDYWTGVACSNEYTLDAAGGFLKSIAKAEEDSALGFVYALMRVASGHFDTALVVGVTKGSEVPPAPVLTSLESEPFYQRPVGIQDLAAAAFQAMEYMRRYDVRPEQAALVAQKNLAHAGRNAYAHRREAPALDDILRAPIVAYPLRAWDCPPASDGACAVLLAAEGVAEKLTDRPVWVRGVGWAVDHYYLGDRDLLDGALVVAARRAYAMANIAEPRREIRVAEVCDISSYHELLWYEQLGFCGRGEGGRLVESGATRLEGELPVNPSGGVLASNPYVARGLVRVAEAALQVAGAAGEHQVHGATVALAHSCHGLAAQCHTVVVLGI